MDNNDCNNEAMIELTIKMKVQHKKQASKPAVILPKRNMNFLQHVERNVGRNDYISFYLFSHGRVFQ